MEFFYYNIYFIADPLEVNLVSRLISFPSYFNSESHRHIDLQDSSSSL